MKYFATVQSMFKLMVRLNGRIIVIYFKNAMDFHVRSRQGMFIEPLMFVMKRMMEL